LLALDVLSRVFFSLSLPLNIQHLECMVRGFVQPFLWLLLFFHRFQPS